MFTLATPHLTSFPPSLAPRWWRSLGPRWQQLLRRDEAGMPSAKGHIYAAPYRCVGVDGWMCEFVWTFVTLRG